LTDRSPRIIVGPHSRSGGDLVASKQTRRSISVRGTTYDNLRRYCEENSVSMSEVVEQQLARLLEQKDAPHVAPPQPTGRPAPVAYEKVVAPRIARAPQGDYRTIRF
jgi:hypothetical protein